jgi:hypothetical protein
VLSSGERMLAVLRSLLSGTRRDVGTPLCQESPFAERTTQDKLIAATQNERPFAVTSAKVVYRFENAPRALSASGLHVLG